MRAVRRRIESFAAGWGFSEEKVRDVSLAVAEALFNAMEHGSHEDGTLGIEAHFNGARLEVAVEEVGSSAEDERRLQELGRALVAPLAGALPEADLERGRGLYLIRARSDEVRVERARGGGVRVVMVKRR
ncbi:MAG: ATP-binding protein [Planctomycetes bacterium]|nr:ATP-binding protein [Planctomycetota bacterium]